MGSVRNLIVKLSADVAELQKGLDRGANETRKFRQQVERDSLSVRKSFEKISSAVRTVSTAFAALGIAHLIRQQIEFADELSEVAEQLGVQTEEFSILVGIAKRANVEMTGLETIMRRVADQAASGSNAFKRLGLDAAQLARLPIDKQLRAVVSALNGIENQSERIAAATNLVGSRGAGQIIQLANNFEKAEQAARRFGDAVTEEEVRIAKRADDILNNLSSAVGKFFRRTLVGVGTPVTVEQLADAVAQLGEQLKTIEPSSPDFARIQAQIAAYVEEIDRLRAEQQAAAASSLAFADGLNEIEVTARKITDPLKAVNDQAAKLTASARTAADALRAEIEEAQAFFQAGLITQETLTQLVSKAAAEFAEADPIVKAYNDRLKEAQQIVKDSRTPLQEFVDEVERINRAAAEFPQIVTPEVVTQAATQAAEQFKTATDKANAKLNQMSEFAVQAARNMQSAFADFLFDPFEDGLRGLLSNFINVLRRMAAEAAAARIFEHLGLGGKSGDGGLVAGGPFKAGSPFQAFWEKIFGLPGRAAGGPVTAGRPYLVGERGPELFVPGASGRIESNGQLGGVTIAPVYNIDARGATTDLVAALPRILEAQSARTKAELLEMLQRRHAVA